MYGGVFHRIEVEEDQYRDEGAEFLPLFGTSTTAYEEVRYPHMYMCMYYMYVQDSHVHVHVHVLHER